MVSATSLGKVITLKKANEQMKTKCLKRIDENKLICKYVWESCAFFYFSLNLLMFLNLYYQFYEVSNLLRKTRMLQVYRLSDQSVNPKTITQTLLCVDLFPEQAAVETLALEMVQLCGGTPLDPAVCRVWQEG